MSEKLRFLLQRVWRRSWVRCALFSLFALLAVLSSTLLGPLIPQDIALKLGSDSIGSLLNILASSMLTVAIFSASTMVASFAAVANSATPRASQLLIEDSTIQNTLAVFIGAFLYSVIALVGLHAHVYGDGGRLVLFGFTLVILLLVVVVLLRWIDYLSVMGRLGETIRRVEAATIEAMDQRLQKPYLGGRPQQPDERGTHAVEAPTTGFVQHVSLDLLQARAETLGAVVHLHVLPGAFVEPATRIASTDGPLDDASRKAISDAVLIGATRTFDHDPRFGLVVMGEIASRALSPSVNDPGSALDVLAAGVKTLHHWASGCRQRDDTAPEVVFDRVSVPPVREAGMVDDLFTPVARYGAASVEVGVALQRALGSVMRFSHPPFDAEAKRLAHYALVRADHAGLCGPDLDALCAAGRAAAAHTESPRR